MDFNFLYDILDARQIKESEPMSRHTTFGIGGPADYFLLPASKEELCAVVRETEARGVPLTVMGGGANLLVRDKGIRGVVVCTSRMQNIAVSGNKICAEAGVSTVRTAREACKAGLSGMEFAGGIPGTLGGAAYMNAGAYGGEMSQIVSEITSCDMKGRLHHYYGHELEYSYRHSLFMSNHEIIVDITLDMTPAHKDVIKEKMDEYNSRRKAKQPLQDRSAGSTFKRPTGHFVGQMLEYLGLKGFAVGDAQVSTKHAGFLVNKGNASCNDMLNLISEIQTRVKAEFDVDIEPEVRIIGEE